jgi:hypothetical protein
VTGWLPGPHADDLLAKLTANATWEQRDRWMANRAVIEPRLTAEYYVLFIASRHRANLLVLASRIRR